MATLRPTFSESWYRVADLRAKLRPSAQISRQHYRGDRWYVVRDPAGNQYHRLSAPAYRFVGLLDGSRTVSEAWELVGGQLADDAPTQNEVIQILSQLHAANLLESNVTPDAAVLLRRHKKMVKRQWQGRLMNILFPRIPLWDPDRFLVRWMPVVKPFVSWWGFVLWLGVIIWAIAAIAPEWPRLKNSASAAIAPGNWLLLGAVFWFIKLIHELGHGFACRRFGGECHELGIMFLVMIPAPYVDASSAWSFPNKWARMLVGMGGMVIELFLAAILAFVWKYTNDSQLIHHVAFNGMLIASVSTVIFNANPLLRYDGYYILSDWLEIPNLRYRSSEYTLGLVKRHLFKVKLPTPLPPPGQRVWLFSYAVLSTIYRTWVGVMIILLVWGQVPILGQIMAISGLVTWLFVPIFKLTKYLFLEPELHRKRGRAVAWTLAFAGCLALLFGVVPFKTTFQAVGVVEPAQKVLIHADVNGRVTEIKVRDGQQLAKGDPIVVCQDTELETRLEMLTAQHKRLIVEREQARVTDQARMGFVEKDLAVVEKELDDINRKLEQLTIRAPIDGILVAPQLREFQDRYLRQGDEVAMVATTDDLRITALVDQSDGAMVYLAPDTKAEVRLGSMRGREITATIDPERRGTSTMELPHPALGHAGGGDAEVDPSDEKGRQLVRPYVQFWLTLPNDQGYLPGQRAHLRFTLKSEPLYVWARRRIGQLIQTYGNSKWL